MASGRRAASSTFCCTSRHKSLLHASRYQHPTFNLDKCARDSLSREAIAGEFLRDVGQYGRWKYEPERLQVTEECLSDSEIQQTADSITFCLNTLIKHLKGVDKTDKMNRTELDAFVRGVLEWFPVATMALEYILYRTEDEDAGTLFIIHAKSL